MPEQFQQFHSLFCPKCDKTVRIPYATEIAERNCPTKDCGAQATELWPSKAMYERALLHRVNGE